MAEVSTHSGAREGDVYEPFNKKIKDLILRTDKCIVFLDEEYWVWWDADGDCFDGPNDAEVLNHVAILETVPTNHLDQADLRAFRRLTAEGLARYIDSQNIAASRHLFDKAREFIIARRAELSRRWLLKYSIVWSGIVAVLLAVIWLTREWLVVKIGPTAQIVLISGMIGALGSFLSILLRLGDLPLDPSAGPLLHHFEVGARILSGLLGGGFTVLALKGGILLGVLTQSQNAAPAIFAMAFVAGASERLVPSLINRVEIASTQSSEKRENDVTKTKEKTPTDSHASPTP